MEVQLQSPTMGGTTMQAQSLYPSPAIPDGTQSDDALMQECDRLEHDLGVWLTQRGKPLVQRANRGQTGSEPASLWRTLVHVWCTSPETRATYSDQVRHGLLAALDSMDDPTAMALIRSMMEEVQPPAAAMRTAA